jgi:hypothetical protein
MAAAIWGLLLLVSFIAWGRTLARALPGARPLGWGFDGCVGMSLTVAVFGVLACMRLVSVATVMVWTAAGPLVFGLSRAEPTPLRTRLPWLAQMRRPTVVFLLGLGLLAVAVAFKYAHAVTDVTFNTWDDEMAYRAFARQFLDTGTLYEPFSYRRIASYGGQSLLQALVLAVADRDRLHILDNGICWILVFGLVTGYARTGGSAARAAVLAAALIAVTLPHTPHNLASEVSGELLFLALFRLFDDPGFERVPIRTSAILTGVLAAAACTLRQTYLAAAVLFVGSFHGLLTWLPRGADRRAAIRRATETAAAAFLFLAPWMVLAVLTVRTPLYPLLNGNMRADAGTAGSVSGYEELRWTLTNLLNLTGSKPVQTLPLFFVAAFFLPFVRRNRAVHAFLAAATLAFVLTLHFFRTQIDGDSIARYHFAFTVAFCLAVTLRVLRMVGKRRRAGATLVAAMVAVVAVGQQIIGARDPIMKRAVADITGLDELMKRHAVKPAELDETYARLQGSVPAGQRMLTMLEHSYLLDGRRNPYYHYDYPGMMGPRPGPPDFQGPEAFADYMRSLRIRYIAYQLGASSKEYNEVYWQQNLNAETPPHGRSGFHKNQARFELDFFATLRELSRSRKSVFSEGELRVLDLETPAN